MLGKVLTTAEPPVRETRAAFFPRRSDAYAVMPWGQLVVVKAGAS